jgi:hypothetical protein
MGIFWKNGRRGEGGSDNPPWWVEARAFVVDCARVAHPDGMEAPIPPQARRHIFPALSDADWIRVRVHHQARQLLDEKRVRDLDDLDQDGKRVLVSIASPYVLPPEMIAKVVATNPDQLGWIAQDHAAWKAALARRKPRVNPNEDVGQALARLHPDPGLAAAYDMGAEDLRTGAWRQGESLWFFLPYAVARDRGILIDTPPPFAALDDEARGALSWMHRTILSGLDSLELMAEAGAGEDPESPRAGTGTVLAEQIYPFQCCAGRLLMEWKIPCPLPTGAQPVSRVCAWDTALSLFRAARNHERARRTRD